MTCALYQSAQGKLKKHPSASSAWRFETACQRTTVEVDVIRPRVQLWGSFLRIPAQLVRELCQTPQRPPKTWFPRQVQEAMRKSIVSSALRRWMFQNGLWHWGIVDFFFEPNNLSGPLPKHCTRSSTLEPGPSSVAQNICCAHRSISESEALYLSLFACS